MSIPLPTKSWPDPERFWGEFTTPEKRAILDNPAFSAALADLKSYSGVVLATDSHIADGLAGLVAAGILTQERSTAITTP